MLIFAACKKLNDTQCRCSIQGADACRRITHSHCASLNAEGDEACICQPGFENFGGSTCGPTCEPKFVSDGLLIKPFVQDRRANPKFEPVRGDEPFDMFEFQPNGYHLQAKGVVNSLHTIIC